MSVTKQTVTLVKSSVM